jgi:small-conductance mechanosensitive channel
VDGLHGLCHRGRRGLFAAWSVLSNLFCALLIVIVGPFRLGDYIEVLDTAEKPGAKGRVIDINMLYTTLQDAHAPEGAPNLLQIPNSLIFQRVVKRWKGGLGADGEHATHGEEERAMRLTTPHDAQPSQPPLHTTN